VQTFSIGKVVCAEWPPRASGLKTDSARCRAWLPIRLKVVVRDHLGLEHEFKVERVWLLVALMCAHALFLAIALCWQGSTAATTSSRPSRRHCSLTAIQLHNRGARLWGARGLSAAKVTGTGIRDVGVDAA
jgi:hypothetical protein